MWLGKQRIMGRQLYGTLWTPGLVIKLSPWSEKMKDCRVSWSSGTFSTKMSWYFLQHTIFRDSYLFLLNLTVLYMRILTTFSFLNDSLRFFSFPQHLPFRDLRKINTMFIVYIFLYIIYYETWILGLAKYIRARQT